jgi:hypothetical protein
VFGAAVEGHASQSDADCAGGHNDDFVAIVVEFDCGLDYEGEYGEERLVRFLVDYGAGSCRSGS